MYQECLGLEMTARGIPFVPQVELGLTYKGRVLRQTYVPDFICFEAIVVELKAVTDLADIHRAQVQNYLRATRHRLGFLVNFGHYPGLQHDRIIN